MLKMMNLWPDYNEIIKEPVEIEISAIYDEVKSFNRYFYLIERRSDGLRFLKPVFEFLTGFPTIYACYKTRGR